VHDKRLHDFEAMKSWIEGRGVWEAGKYQLEDGGGDTQ